MCVLQPVSACVLACSATGPPDGGWVSRESMPAVKGIASCMTADICAYRGLIQLKGGSKGMHESQVEVPSKQLVKVRCCDSIWPADSFNESDSRITPWTHWGFLSSLNRPRCRLTSTAYTVLCT